MSSLRWVLAAAAVSLAAPPALALHRHHRASAPLADRQAPDRTWGGWQAGVIARATAAEQRAPGLTEELAPDAKETATGGPVGGVPGFDGL